MSDGGYERVRGVAAFVCGLALALAAAFAGPVSTPASAATGLAVSVDVTGITIAGSKPTDEATVTATVTNTGSVDAYGVQARLWRARDPISDLATMRDAPATTDGWGSTVIASGQTFDVLTLSTVPFPPGTTAEVTLKATLAQLGFDTPGAVYPIGVRVLGTADASSNYTLIGQSRTFATLPATTPVPVTPIVFLSAPPTQLTGNLFSDDTLAADLSGRLNDLLSAVEAGQASYLVDPALVEEVADMADGYEVYHAGGKNTPGTGQRVAAEWLARFEALPAGEGARTLFADPDLAASADAPTWVAQAQDACGQAQEACARALALPLVAIPPGLAATTSYVASLAGVTPAAVMAANIDSGQVSSTGIGALAVPVTAFGGAGQPGPDALDVLASAALAGGQVRLITDDAGLASSNQTMTPWMRRVPLGSLLAQQPGAPAAYAPAKPQGLSATERAAVTRASADLPLYSQVVPSAALAGDEPAVLSRLASSQWAGNPDAWQAYRSAVISLSDVRALREQITLNVSPRVVMSSQSNDFPVTVTNALPTPVDVAIVTTTDNAAISVPTSTATTIPAKVSQTIVLSPQARGDGIAIANISVAAVDGHAITPASQVTIEVTNLGIIGWIIIGCSAAVLAVATVVRIRQVAKGAVRHAPKGDADS